MRFLSLLSFLSVEIAKISIPGKIVKIQEEKAAQRYCSRRYCSWTQKLYQSFDRVVKQKNE